MANVVINAPPAIARAIAPAPQVVIEQGGHTTSVPPDPQPEQPQPNPGYEPDGHIDYTASGYEQGDGNTVIAVQPAGPSLVAPTSLLESGFAAVPFVIAIAAIAASLALVRRMRDLGIR